VLITFTLGPLVLAAAYFGGYWFLGFVALISVISFWELSQMALKKETIVTTGLGSVVILFFLINLHENWVAPLDVIFFSVPLFMFRELFRNKGSALSNLGATYLGLFYIGICTGSLVLIRDFAGFRDNQGGLFVISYIVSIWLSDTSAYFGGLTFGKHRLLERVSPKKSTEGFYFGMAGAVGSFFLFRWLFLDFLLVQDAVILGLTVGIVGPLGDLSESLIKRDVGVKDSSNLLADHGGFFDRFDSIIASAPFVYLYLKNFIEL